MEFYYLEDQDLSENQQPFMIQLNILFQKDL